MEIFKVDSPLVDKLTISAELFTYLKQSMQSKSDKRFSLSTKTNVYKFQIHWETPENSHAQKVKERTTLENEMAQAESVLYQFIKEKKKYEEKIH